MNANCAETMAEGRDQPRGLRCGVSGQVFFLRNYKSVGWDFRRDRLTTPLETTRLCSRNALSEYLTAHESSVDDPAPVNRLLREGLNRERGKGHSRHILSACSPFSGGLLEELPVQGRRGVYFTERIFNTETLGNLKVGRQRVNERPQRGLLGVPLTSEVVLQRLRDPSARFSYVYDMQMDFMLGTHQ